MQDFSDYIVYVDESGDHGLKNIDPYYPVFVLAFCVFEKQRYIRDIVPAFQSFKFDHFGHDMVVLHEREIRKRSGAFRTLSSKDLETSFMADLNSLVEQAEFTVIASVIRKDVLQSRYPYPQNPYNLALAFCLERLFLLLKDRSAGDRGVHVIFERRGSREDNDLELQFRRVCGGQNPLGNAPTLPFEPIFASKAANSCGMQIADLVARPIGRNVLNPQQTNRAFDIIRAKFRHKKGEPDRINGFGLKIFP